MTHQELLVKLRDSLRASDEEMAAHGRIATTDVSQLVDLLTCIIEHRPERASTMETVTRRARQINAGAPHTLTIVDIAWRASDLVATPGSGS